MGCFWEILEILGLMLNLKSSVILQMKYAEELSWLPGVYPFTGSGNVNTSILHLTLEKFPGPGPQLLPP